MAITTHGDSYSCFFEPVAGTTEWTFEFDYVDRAAVHALYVDTNDVQRALAVTFVDANTLSFDLPDTVQALLIYRKTALDSAPARFFYGGTRAKDSILGDAITKQLHFIQEAREAPEIPCVLSGGVPAEED